MPTRAALVPRPAIERALAGIDEALGRLDAPDPASMEASFTVGIDEYSANQFGTGFGSR